MATGAIPINHSVAASVVLAIANLIELPEPAHLLNQLKGRRNKSKVELADVETILEILEGA
ncbi:hypothetical protein [Microcoleus sp. S36b_A4]|uniref:hypothetical protein n=1 Tax=Microcoleus sp. S36b_A4 TaxID=3055420 RepID=UPI002FCECDD1